MIAYPIFEVNEFFITRLLFDNFKTFVVLIGLLIFLFQACGKDSAKIPFFRNHFTFTPNVTTSDNSVSDQIESSFV